MISVCPSRPQAVKRREHFCFTPCHILRVWHNAGVDVVRNPLLEQMTELSSSSADMSKSLMSSGPQRTSHITTLREVTETRVNETEKGATDGSLQDSFSKAGRVWWETEMREGLDCSLRSPDLSQ